MKCGIMTFHRAVNYGAVLQAYALKSYISETLNTDCDVIDYRCKSIENMYKVNFPKGNITALIKYPIKYYTNSMKLKKFKKFLYDDIKIGKSVNKNELKQESEKYDIILTGSDQVWGKSRIGIDNSYFLDFVDDSSKKASYAASLGYTDFDTKTDSEYINLLCDFENISVREKTGAEYLRKLLNKDVEVSLDPTLLLNADEWKKIAAQRFMNEKYVLIYSLTYSDKVVKTAKKIAKEKGLEVYNIGAKCNDAGVKKCQSLSPQEWIGMFMNASYIVTNSFHGTAFSVNFHKNFNTEISEGLKNRGSRISDLLEELGLENRLLNNTEDFSDVNYTYADDKLILKRKEADKYLRKVLSLN